MKAKLFFIAAALFVTKAAVANNIVVSNVSLSGQDVGANTAIINFDVAWENSWRTSTNESNYDGAWVFVKFRKNGTSAWNHCHVKTLSAAPDAAHTDTPDSMGVFVYRSNDFIGNVNYTANQFTWHYGADGVLDNDNVEIRVFALEMVFIPTGQFFLGSGGSETNAFKKGSTTEPFLISSANAIPTGTSGDVLNFNGAGTAAGNLIAASFPNGFNAYWIMKYECSQQQYADFLNHLTQQEATTLVQGNTGINTIFGTTAWPDFEPVAPERAYNNVSKAKFLAYADWTGLRPMSEMEFEKACRGSNITPVANEFAWGNTNLTNLQELNQIENGQTANESVINTLQANAVTLGNVNRPVRVGIFARPSGSSRMLSGGTYYGVMNMSDNVCEFAVYSGNAAGQAVTSSVHGNGYLNSNGSGVTDIPTWIVTAIGVRGAYYDGLDDRARVSDRADIDYTFTGNAVGLGIRAVRTAP